MTYSSHQKLADGLFAAPPYQVNATMLCTSRSTTETRGGMKGEEVMIDEAAAIEKARALAEERGWMWREPIEVSRSRSFVVFGRVTFEVRTNTEQMGSNVRVVLDAETGEVVEAVFLPR